MVPWLVGPHLPFGRTHFSMMLFCTRSFLSRLPHRPVCLLLESALHGSQQGGLTEWMLSAAMTVRKAPSTAAGCVDASEGREPSENSILGAPVAGVTPASIHLTISSFL